MRRLAPQQLNLMVYECMHFPTPWCFFGPYGSPRGPGLTPWAITKDWMIWNSATLVEKQWNLYMIFVIILFVYLRPLLWKAYVVLLCFMYRVWIIMKPPFKYLNIISLTLMVWDLANLESFFFFFNPERFYICLQTRVAVTWVLSSLCLSVCFRDGIWQSGGRFILQHLLHCDSGLGLPLSLLLLQLWTSLGELQKQLEHRWACRWQSKHAWRETLVLSHPQTGHYMHVVHACCFNFNDNVDLWALCVFTCVSPQRRVWSLMGVEVLTRR